MYKLKACIEIPFWVWAVMAVKSAKLKKRSNANFDVEWITQPILLQLTANKKAFDLKFRISSWNGMPKDRIFTFCCTHLLHNSVHKSCTKHYRPYLYLILWNCETTSLETMSILYEFFGGISIILFWYTPQGNSVWFIISSAGFHLLP